MCISAEAVSHQIGLIGSVGGWVFVNMISRELQEAWISYFCMCKASKGAYLPRLLCTCKNNKKFMPFVAPEKSRWQKVIHPQTQLTQFDVTQPQLCWGTAKLNRMIMLSPVYSTSLTSPTRTNFKLVSQTVSDLPDTLANSSVHFQYSNGYLASAICKYSADVRKNSGNNYSTYGRDFLFSLF